MEAILFRISHAFAFAGLPTSQVWIPGPGRCRFHQLPPFASSLQKAHGQYHFLTLAQPLHRLTQGNLLNPGYILVLVIADLVHHIDRITAVVIDRLKQGYRVLYGIQREDYILLGTLSTSEISKIVGSLEFTVVRLSLT